MSRGKEVRRKRVKREVKPEEYGKMVYLVLKFEPITGIIGYRPDKWVPLIAKRYLEMGWIDEMYKEVVPHLDRIFERDNKGRPIIYFVHLKAVLKRGLEHLASEGKIPPHLVDIIPSCIYIHHVTVRRKKVVEGGKEKEVEEYVVEKPRVQYFYFMEKPVIITRTLSSETVCTFEVIIPPNYSIFALEVPEKFAKHVYEALVWAGLDIGIFGQKKLGHGRFSVTLLKVVE